MRILYIDIDSCRADHLGCYGYHRSTSPHMDAVAAEGVRFDRYYTTDAPCLPSRTALYTGMYGIHSGVVGHGGTAADLRIEGAGRGFRDRIELQSLPSAMQYNGLYTAQISPFGQRHAARQFYAGFNEIRNTGKGGMESAEEVTPVVMKWLEDKARDDNWFLHVNYWDPHTPYRVPAEYENVFAEEPLPEWLTEEVLKEHQKLVGPHKALEISMFSDVEDPQFPRQPGALRSMDDLRRCIDGYDLGVRYVDDQVGQIVNWLKANGLYEDTAIIISADHGENLGELGIYGEHGTADEITCRVPMIIKWPGMRAGAADEGLHYNIDMAPTFAELLGMERQPCWDGKSYVESLRSDVDTGRDYLVISQCAHVCQRSVRFGPWLYIRTYHDGYHLFPKEMLFDVVQDPHERHNVASEHRQVCDEALRYLSDWHDERMVSMPYADDPLWTVMKEGGPFHARGRARAYCEHLERTGRGWAVEEIRRRHPQEFA